MCLFYGIFSMPGAVSGSPWSMSCNHRYKQLPMISRCLDGVEQALMIIWIATSVIAITPVVKWGVASANHMGDVWNITLILLTINWYQSSFPFELLLQMFTELLFKLVTLRMKHLFYDYDAAIVQKDKKNFLWVCQPINDCQPFYYTVHPVFFFHLQMTVVGHTI